MPSARAIAALRLSRSGAFEGSACCRRRRPVRTTSGIDSANTAGLAGGEEAQHMRVAGNRVGLYVGPDFYRGLRARALRPVERAQHWRLDRAGPVRCLETFCPLLSLGCAGGRSLSHSHQRSERGSIATRTLGYVEDEVFGF